MSLRYEGCTLFRQRIVAATLSQKPLRIDKIRDQDDSPGLHDFEANFLRLIDTLTDGKVSAFVCECLSVCMFVCMPVCMTEYLTICVHACLCAFVYVLTYYQAQGLID